MAGNWLGGLKAKQTILEKDPDFYKKTKGLRRQSRASKGERCQRW